MTERPDLKGSFAHGAGDYARLRPSYPQDAVSFLTGGVTGLDVVDIGAGTGKLTEQLHAAGHRVVAVEPSAAMREELAALGRERGFEVVAATGESTGLPTGSADLVTYAQAWHWLDPEMAGREAARLLRPGGALGMVWNMLDNSVPWVADYEAAAHATLRAWRPEPAGQVRETPPGGPFGPVESTLVRWTRPVTVEALEQEVRTRSYYLEGGPEEQRTIRERVAAAVAEHHGHLEVHDPVQLPYVTTVLRYVTG